ncbi:unnamed protein product [Medioppia subpectinata]|uniref:Kinase n=1 Tax=Medioppia subpectinata TaxID=1979941 RepID=A0A7R9KBS5_9ACAR|nr:unnamed protein product [Medioppia subpectinata]CAG2100491.1 unnamed protein product [Medioppia subpectinata]
MGDQLNDDNVITLEPFVHQVGGRSTILVFGQTICKPIISRELAFYETTPTELKPFIPEFRGISEVYFSESSDGYLTITTKPPNSYIDEDNSQQNAKYRIKLCKPNGDVIENKDKPSPHGERKHAFEHSKHDLPEITNNSSTKIHNPWVLKTISALKVNHSYQRKKFLLLENLTFRFKSPCVMDLKMGVRQHDDFADDDKIKTHSLKVSNTTSGTLGLRITGVQVYNKTMDHFKCHNKYYGRTLSPEGFVETFKMFLQIENKLRSDLINLMIHKLEKMLSVVEKLDTFRFYTSSLLIIYEGNADHISKSDTNLVDIRMIDFAHTTHEGMGGHIQDNNGPDRGYIFGLTNLITILKDIESEIM